MVWLKKPKWEEQHWVYVSVAWKSKTSLCFNLVKKQKAKIAVCFSFTMMDVIRNYTMNTINIYFKGKVKQFTSSKTIRQLCKYYRIDVSLALHETHQYVWLSKHIWSWLCCPDMNHSFGPHWIRAMQLRESELRRTMRMIGCPAQDWLSNTTKWWNDENTEWQGCD